MAETARHFDDKRALAYDVLIRRIVPGYESLHGLARLLLVQALPDQAHVLVAGAGTGMELASLAKACPNWRFTAVDPSQAMLAVAQRRAEEAGLADRIIFHAGFVHDLPEESVFDAATLLLVMHFVADDGGKAQLLASIARRLRPQAPLLLADLNADAGNQRYQSFIRAWRAWQIDAGIPEEDVDKGFERIVKDIHFVPESRIRALLTGAGFGDPECFFSALLFSAWVMART